MTLTRSKDKVKVTGLLNFRQLAKPCMLAAMTAAPLRGFLVYQPDALSPNQRCQALKAFSFLSEKFEKRGFTNFLKMKPCWQ